MKVFIVFGQTGEYSDHSNWAVKGFVDKTRAEAFELAATKWAHEAKSRVGRYEPIKEPSPYDPKFRCDYTGTDYFTVEVEIEDLTK